MFEGKLVPTAAVDGERLEIVGVAAAEMVSVDAADVAPPGFCTVMLTLPAVASNAAGTVAVMLVVVLAVTVSAVVPR